MSKRARAGAAAASLVIWALLASGHLAQGAASAYILAAEAHPIDTNGNVLFDELLITVLLDPPESGTYLVAVTLKWPTTGTTIASQSTIAALPKALARLNFTIDGTKINEKQLDGPYNLTVDLLSSPSGPVNDVATFTTPPLRYTEFERTGERDKPRLTVGQDEIQLATPNLNASVNLSSPAVTWGYPPSSPVTAAFESRFPRVVAFADDGDRAFESGELLASADFTQTTWSILSLEIGPSAEWGSYIQFSLGAAVDFRDLSGGLAGAGSIEIGFLITQRNGTANGSTPFPILGGLEVKIDVRLTLTSALNASDLAFEIELRDLTHNHSFLMRGPSGYETVDPLAANTTAITPLAPGTPADLERVSFVDAQGVPRGHFSWLTIARQNLTGGQERFVAVSPSEGLRNGALRLFLAVPNDATLRSTLLDPAVGVARLPTTPGGGTPPPPPTPEPPPLVVFLAALAAVSAMFFFSVYARAKKY